MRAEAIRTLMRRGKVNQHEASYYLDEPGGGTDVAAALAALEAARLDQLQPLEELRGDPEGLAVDFGEGLAQLSRPSQDRDADQLQ